jgi:hypothetical protein
MGINSRMGGLVNRLIMAQRSPRHKEHCLFIGKRSKWAIVRHGYKAIMDDASARVYGETLMPVCCVDAQGAGSWSRDGSCKRG